MRPGFIEFGSTLTLWRSSECVQSMSSLPAWSLLKRHGVRLSDVIVNHSGEGVGQGMRQQLVSYDKEPLCDEVECDPEKYCLPMLNISLYCE